MLHSHTPETAAQEVAALLMASAIMAEQRLAAARKGNVEPRNMSFIKTLQCMSSFRMVLAEAKELSKMIRLGKCMHVSDNQLSGKQRLHEENGHAPARSDRH